MALATISVPSFPNIPDLPGVPAVKRDLQAAVTAVNTVISGINGVFSKKFTIVDDTGNPVITPDTFLGIRYANRHTIAQAPLEKGSFTSYNKVTMPFEGVVIMTVGGAVSDRQSFLDTLESMVRDTNLYSIVTPEAVYQNCNLEGFDYRREQRNGAGLIEAHCRFKEIRQAEGTQYSSKSSVPDSSKTNSTTSTGMPDPSSVSSATAQAVVHTGLVNTKAIGNQVQTAVSTLLASGGG